MKIPKFFKKKRNIWIIVILVLVVLLSSFFIFANKNNAKAIQTGFALRQDLKQTVLATGQVVSGTDLSLGFQAGGIVRRVSVKEGDEVQEGQTLAVLDQSSALATLTTAQGSLAQAKANYEKLLAGATPQDVKITEDAVTSAQHDLKSSYDSTLITLNDAYTKIFNSYATVISVQNSYFSASDQQGLKVSNSVLTINTDMQAVKTYVDTAKSSQSSGDIDNAVSQMLLVLNDIFNHLSVIRSQLDEGIYYNKVSSTDKASIDTQKVNINTVLTNITTAKQSIVSDGIALQKAQHQLDLKKAPPTQAEIDLAKAQMLSAQGQVDAAQATLHNMVITAPMSGTITEVNIKAGEQATAMAKVIVLQNTQDLHTEADVSEANIAALVVGQDIDYTFDALGPDKHFQGKILTINPASTVVSGVVNYKVTGSLDVIPEIKPGMTANMTILVSTKSSALSVPSTSIINKNSKQYVKVIDDQKKKTYHEVQVQTGLEADGGLVEIISGISDGQEIVTYMKP
jgi:HlyD family secretion protein